MKYNLHFNLIVWQSSIMALASRISKGNILRIKAKWFEWIFPSSGSLSSLNKEVHEHRRKNIYLFQSVNRKYSLSESRKGNKKYRTWKENRACFCDSQWSSIRKNHAFFAWLAFLMWKSVTILRADLARYLHRWEACRW